MIGFVKKTALPKKNLFIKSYACDLKIRFKLDAAIFESPCVIIKHCTTKIEKK